MAKRAEGMIGTTLSSSHRFMRIMNSSLQIMDCHFDFNLEVVSGCAKDKQAELITRQKFWLDNCLEDCIAVPCDRDAGSEWLDRLDNLLLFAPADPNDFLLHMLVHAKLQAIGSGMVNITGSHMTTDHSNGFGMWFDGDPNEILPSQKDWMGERCYFPLPWWHRGDASMIDVICGADDDVTAKPNVIVDWYTLTKTDTVQDHSKSAEIIRPNFRPRIISDD